MTLTVGGTITEEGWRAFTDALSLLVSWGGDLTKGEAHVEAGSGRYEDESLVDEIIALAHEHKLSVSVRYYHPEMGVEVREYSGGDLWFRNPVVDGYEYESPGSPEGSSAIYPGALIISSEANNAKT